MGTNYYLHIGKTSSRGTNPEGDRETAFVYSIPPSLLSFMAECWPGVCVANEYGDETTLGNFNDRVEAAYIKETDSIGRDFS